MSSADKMQAGGNLSVNPGGRLADEWPARGRRSGMSFADFAFVQVVQGTTITSNKKKEFCKKRAGLLAARPGRRRIDTFSFEMVTGGAITLAITLRH
jgi:hypothetical protein